MNSIPGVGIGVDGQQIAPPITARLCLGSRCSGGLAADSSSNSHRQRRR